jgi:hypothetical protein
VTEFLKLLLEQQPDRHRRIGAAGLAAKKYGVGQPSTCGLFVEYGQQDYAAADQLLGSEKAAKALPPSVLPSTKPKPAAPSPIQRALPQKVVAPEERNRVDVRGRLIAAHMIGLGEPAKWPNHFVTLDWQQASQLPLEVVVICQRLETLLHLQQFAWLPQYLRERRAMAVYAGDTNSFYRDGPVKNLLDAVAVPVLCLFDWNPRSLVSASRIKRFEAFCWPPRLTQCKVQTVPASFEAMARYYSLQLSGLQGDALIDTWAKFQKIRKVWSTLDFVHCI